MAEIHGTEHDLLRQLLGLGLDHQNAFMRSGHDKVKFRAVHLIDSRVQHISTINPADARSGNRTKERHARQRQRRRGTNHCRNVWVVFHVMRQHCTDDLCFAFEVTWKKRTDWPVNQAADQRFIF